MIRGTREIQGGKFKPFEKLKATQHSYPASSARGFFNQDPGEVRGSWRSEINELSDIVQNIASHTLNKKQKYSFKTKGEITDLKMTWEQPTSIET